MKLSQAILRVGRGTGVEPESLEPRTNPARRGITAKAGRPIPSPNGNTVKVPFVFLELARSPARSVCIAGTFNEWRPGVTPMIHVGDGCWIKELCLPPGNHEYRLVVDGEWIPDLWADDFAPNPFGGINSVLTIVTTTPRPAGNRPCPAPS